MLACLPLNAGRRAAYAIIIFYFHDGGMSWQKNISSSHCIDNNYHHHHIISYSRRGAALLHRHPATFAARRRPRPRPAAPQPSWTSVAAAQHRSASPQHMRRGAPLPSAAPWSGVSYGHSIAIMCIPTCIKRRRVTFRGALPGCGRRPGISYNIM